MMTSNNLQAVPAVNTSAGTVAPQGISLNDGRTSCGRQMPPEATIQKFKELMGETISAEVPDNKTVQGAISVLEKQLVAAGIIPMMQEILQVGQPDATLETIPENASNSAPVVTDSTPLSVFPETLAVPQSQQQTQPVVSETSSLLPAQQSPATMAAVETPVISLTQTPTVAVAEVPALPQQQGNPIPAVVAPTSIPVTPQPQLTPTVTAVPEVPASLGVLPLSTGEPFVQPQPLTMSVAIAADIPVGPQQQPVPNVNIDATVVSLPLTTPTVEEAPLATQSIATPQINAEAAVAAPLPQATPQNNAEATVAAPLPQATPQSNAEATVIAAPLPQAAPQSNAEATVAAPLPQATPQINAEATAAAPLPQATPQINAEATVIAATLPQETAFVNEFPSGSQIHPVASVVVTDAGVAAQPQVEHSAVSTTPMQTTTADAIPVLPEDAVVSEPVEENTAAVFSKKRILSVDTTESAIAQQFMVVPMTVASTETTQIYQVTLPPIEVITAQALRANLPPELFQAAEGVVQTMQVVENPLTNTSEIKIQLQPNVLDGAAISITVSDGTLAVSFSTTQNNVALLLERNQSQLVEHLTTQLSTFPNVRISILRAANRRTEENA